MKYLKPRFLNQGEGALVVEFGDEVDPAINARVISLDTILRELALPGLRETTPSFRSLLVYYEPIDINCRELIKKIEEIIDSQKISINLNENEIESLKKLDHEHIIKFEEYFKE